jgi:type I restriction enzyme R subunit
VGAAVRLELHGRGADQAERAAIKKKYATEDAIASAPKRIEAICLDLIDHYTKYIQPNGFKAQIVTVSREAAVTYKETLDRLNAPPSEIAISTSNDDPAHLVRWGRSKEARDTIVKRFTSEQDPLQIIVVCDMLLTGFDAPVEQVMYLDSPLKEHTLLQAIARVNRKAEKKDYGLVVDYWGVSEALQEALAIFSPSDIQGAMSPKVDELPRLQARHAATMRFFAKVKDRNDLYQCAAVLEPEDVRAEFDVAFRRFAQSLDMMLPDPRALPYNDDMRWLGKVRKAAAAKFRDHSLDISDCGAKVKKLIEDAIVADGVELLVKEVSLFSREFDEKVNALQRPEAKASEMEHAIRHEIHVKLEENPAFYESLRERLEKIIDARRAQRVDAAKQLELLQGLADELRNEARAAQDAGLTDMGFAIYGLLERDLSSKARETSPEYLESRKALAALIEEAVAPGIQVPEWPEKGEVQREMRRRVKQQLRAAGVVDATELEQVTASVMDLAKVRKGR